MTRSIVVVCMGGIGHVQLLLPIVASLSARGMAVYAASRAEFRRRFESAGARFVDLYAGRPLDAADATSIPFPARFVTFAGRYAESLRDELAPLDPALIVYDTFTVIAPVVARLLGIPYVNVYPNHAPVPARMIAALAADPRVAISAECRAAVERLRERFGVRRASPFSYYDSTSPYLNLYGEPAEFLRDEDRAALEPLAFFGALLPPPQAADRVFSRDGHGTKIYVSFGTGVWRYYEELAREAFAVLSRTVPAGDFDVLASLGNHPLPAETRAELERPGFRIVDHVDQWATLAEADVFVTHHGINSTHESIFNEVPMLSVPFFGDQPALAERCRDLGLAIPLAGSPRAVEANVLLGALQRMADERQQYAARLTEARSWELRTIAGREAILDRVMNLSGLRSQHDPE